MPIQKFFHIMQIVDDFDEAQARWDALLSPQTYMAKSWSDFDKRWASLGVIGPEFVIEIMEPSKEPADLGSPLPKFRARHGQHLHSLAWYVDDDDFVPLKKRMADRGVRIIEPYGAVAADEEENNPDAEAAATFFTFPKDTYGQLELQRQPGPGHPHRPPHLEPGWTGAYWRDEHPLGIERLSHVTTMVDDLAGARSFYAEVMEAPAFHEESTDDRDSVFVMVGPDIVHELATPKSADSHMGQDLAAHGNMPYSITFQVPALDPVEAHAAGVGVGVFERTDDTVVLDPAQLSNAIIAFTTRRLPNDPRDAS